VASPQKYANFLWPRHRSVLVCLIPSWTCFARRIEQVSGDAVLLNQGTIYASLVRLQQQGWISAEWGTSDNNRKAKFYSITKRGRRQLSEDAAYWQRLAGVMGRVLALGTETNDK
jgi:PadR family transcriptional regulator, regulatory protein PadR